MAGGRRPLGHIPALLLIVLTAIPAQAAPSDARAASTFRSVVRAWSKADAGGVRGAMDPAGTLRLQLKATHVQGTYRHAQARRVLQDYFRKVSGLRLTDVTPAGQKDDPTFRVRTYEYRYHVKGRDPVKALLQITLKAAKDARWVLVAVEERAWRASRR